MGRQLNELLSRVTCPDILVSQSHTMLATGPWAHGLQSEARRGVEWRRQPRYALIFMFLSIKSGHVARRKSPAQEQSSTSSSYCCCCPGWLPVVLTGWLTPLHSPLLHSTSLHSPVLCPPSRSVVVLPWCLVPLLVLVLFLVLALVLALSWLLSFVGH